MVRFRHWINKNSDVLFFLLIFFLCFGILSISGNLFAGPRIIDDNQIFRLQRELSENGFINVALNEIESRVSPSTRLQYEPRFVPFFCFVKVVKAKIFGGNLLAWSIYMGLLNVCTAFFLFRFAKIINFSTIESVFFSLLVAIGEQSSVWWKLIHGEGLGMFCLGISLMCMAGSIYSEKRQRSAGICFVLFAILASLSKESFILMLPALVFWRVWLTSDRHNIAFADAVRNNVPFIAILLSIFLLELIYITWSGRMIRGMSYAGWEGFYFGNFTRALNQFFLLADSRILLALILCALLICANRTAKDGNLQFVRTYCTRNILMLLVLFFLIVFPQLLLYSKSGFIGTRELTIEEVLFSRYLLPGMIGYAYAIVYILRIIREGRTDQATKQKPYIRNATMILSVVVILLSIGGKLENVYRNATVYAQRSKAIGKWLSSIASNTKESDRILIVCDPTYLLEIRRLDPILCEMLNRKNVEYHPAYVSRYLFKKLEWLKQDNPIYAKVEYRVRDPAEIDAIVIVDKELEEAFLSDSQGWLDPGSFRGYVLVGRLKEEELSRKWKR